MDDEIIFKDKDQSNDPSDDFSLKSLPESKEIMEELFQEEDEILSREIEVYRQDIQNTLQNFREIFLENKEEVFESLRREIENIFKEFDSEHYNSLVLYCGRTYEFLIYQIGWFILKDAMYKFQYCDYNQQDNLKNFREIIKEIKGFLKINTGSNHKKAFNNFDKNISDKRNDIAHPSSYGKVRDVEPEIAKDALKYLIKAIELLSNKFDEILKKNQIVFRTITHQ